MTVSVNTNIVFGNNSFIIADGKVDFQFGNFITQISDPEEFFSAVDKLREVLNNEKTHKKM